MKFPTTLVIALAALASAGAGFHASVAVGQDVGVPVTKQSHEHSRVVSEQGLEALYAVQPDARNQVRRSFGYAVFDSASGDGQVVETVGRRETMMHMTGGVQGGGDFVQVWIFRNREAWRRFTVSGYSFAAGATLPADAPARAWAPPGAMVVSPGISVYHLSDGKLATGVTMAATHYGRVESLD